MQGSPREGRGVILYLRQKGVVLVCWQRFVPIILQDEGADTVENESEIRILPLICVTTVYVIPC